MQIPPYFSVEWRRISAPEAGKCALSGVPFQPGDAIFVNDKPGYSDIRALASQVTRYKIALQVRAWSTNASRHQHRESI